MWEFIGNTHMNQLWPKPILLGSSDEESDSEQSHRRSKPSTKTVAGTTEPPPTPEESKDADESMETEEVECYEADTKCVRL